MSLRRTWNSPTLVLARRLLTYLIMAATISWFAWGIIKFPDAPIHLCDSATDFLYSDHPIGFCGKQGQSHTAEDFRLYDIWQRTILWIWMPGIVAISLLRATAARNRRAR